MPNGARLSSGGNRQLPTCAKPWLPANGSKTSRLVNSVQPGMPNGVSESGSGPRVEFVELAPKISRAVFVGKPSIETRSGAPLRCQKP